MTCLSNVIGTWFKDSDEGEINLSIFLDLKKHPIPLTIKFYCRSYESVVLRVPPTAGSLLI